MRPHTIALLAVLLPGCCKLFSKEEPREVKTEAQIAAEAESKRAEHWPEDRDEIGYVYAWDERQLHNLVFPTEELYEQWATSAVQDDVNARAMVILASYDIPPNTKVKVIRGKLGMLKVSILEGEHSGGAGWITNTLVHRAPIPPAKATAKSVPLKPKPARPSDIVPPNSPPPPPTK